MEGGVWKAYFPEDGETAADAFVIDRKVMKRFLFQDATCAAEAACALDYDFRDGWERGTDADYIVAVIAPDGVETRFRCRNVMSVVHAVMPETEEVE